MKLSNRLKNKALWVSLASFLFIVLQTFEVPVLATDYNTLINGLLAVLVGLGILNNPDTKSRGFKDDK